MHFTPLISLVIYCIFKQLKSVSIKAIFAKNIRRPVIRSEVFVECIKTADWKTKAKCFRTKQLSVC